MQVLIVVIKDIVSRVVVENQTDLISHTYCVFQIIKELDSESGRYLKTTRLVNLYNIKIGKRQQ